MEDFIRDILYTHPNNYKHFNLGEDNSSLIQHIQAQSLPRDPIPLTDVALPSFPGLSPKKRHEITRLASYIKAVVDALKLSSAYIVDVGAGQGYLTRTLLHTIPQIQGVLALDSDEEQTKGAKDWENRWDKSMSTRIRHKVAHITPSSLVSAIDEWMDEQASKKEEFPIILVGLHACGSLTPDTLRAFILSQSLPSPRWTLISAIVISCCYNLLRPSDYPLSPSNPVLHTTARLPSPLPPSAYHLAAQVPSTWHLSESHTAASNLSLCKVVWRALLARLLDQTGIDGADVVKKQRPFIPPSEFTSYQKSKTPTPRQNLQTIADPQAVSGGATPDSSGDSDTGTSPLHRRLGKLPNRCYSSWESFLSDVESRLELEPNTLPRDGDDSYPGPASTLAGTLSSLHTLRCLLGPLIESTILRDRVEWLEASLRGGRDVSSAAAVATDDVDAGACHVISIPNPGEARKVETWSTALVPLFSQTLGSARNVAIVVVPARVAGLVPGFS